MKSLFDRFWAKVEKRGPDECWEWRASYTRGGYGQINRGKRGEGITAAHRVAYELTNGPIPDGLCVCHSCDNPPCCNPAHLWLGTKADNNRDMANKGRRCGIATVRGEQVGTSKLSEAQVLAIRQSSCGIRGEQAALARQFKVSRSLISLILRGEVWAHVRA